MALILLLLSLVLPLAYSPISLPIGFDDAFAIKRTVLEIGVFALLLTWLFRREPQELLRVRLIQVPQVFFPILYFSYLALHSLLIGYGYVSGLKFFLQFCLLVVFLASWHAASEESVVIRLLRCLCVGGVFTTMWGIAQAWMGRLPTSTLGNQNFLASFVLFVIPASCYLFSDEMSKRKYLRSAFYAFTLLLAFIAMVLCKSKAAWLAVVFTAMSLLFLRRQFFWACVLILAGVGLLIAFVPLNALVIELSRDVRPYLWQGAWSMGWSSPWFGKGLGMFFSQIPFYRSPEYFLMDKAADTTLHAHNEYLEIFAETGAIGLILFLVSVFFIVVALARKIMQKEPSQLGTVLFAMLSAILIKNFFDMDLRTTCGAFLFWLVLGMAAARMGGFAVSSPRFRWPLRLSGVLLVLYLLWTYTAPMVRAECLVKSAAREEARGNWAKAQQHYLKAMQCEPGFAEIPFRLGYACIRAGDWDNALAAYRLVRASAPFYSNVVFNMAAVYRQKGDYQHAFAYLDEGFALNPYSLQGHDIAREIFALTGQVAKANKEEAVIKRILLHKRLYPRTFLDMK